MNESQGKILFTHTNSLRKDAKQNRKMKPYPPLATIQAAAILRGQKFEVFVYDSTFEEDLAGFHRLISRLRPSIVIIYEDYFNYIVKMCLQHMQETAYYFCQVARKAGATVIVASPDVVNHPHQYLNNGADYLIMGEADQTVLEICRVLSHGQDPLREQVAGIAALAADGKVETTAPRDLIRNLASLPMPAWDLIEIETYRQAWLRKHGFFSLNIAASRGCPYSCNWCAKPIWGNNYSQRRAEQVAEELTWLSNHYKPDHIWFVDDLFGYTGSWISALQATLQKNGIRIKYTIQCRADLLTPMTVSVLRASGCCEVWLGAESGSQKILKAMNKGIAIEDLRQAINNLKAAGIKAGLFFQFGYPGENLDDIIASIDLIRDLFPDDIGVSVTYPLPGTPLYNAVKMKMCSQRHWHDSEDLAMLFQGAYTTDFYRKLHDLLHTELDLRHRLMAGSESDGPERTALWKEVMNGWMKLGRMETVSRKPALKTTEETRNP